MKSIVRAVFLVAVFGLPLTAFAASETATLTQLGNDVDVSVAVLTKATNWNGAHFVTGCTTVSISLHLDTSTEAGRVAYSTALAAFLAGRDIKVWTSGCLSSAPKVIRVDIK